MSMDGWEDREFSAQGEGLALHRSRASSTMARTGRVQRFSRHDTDNSERVSLLVHWSN